MDPVPREGVSPLPERIAIESEHFVESNCKPLDVLVLTRTVSPVVKDLLDIEEATTSSVSVPVVAYRPSNKIMRAWQR
jgi:hypothetical protein